MASELGIAEPYLCKILNGRLVPSAHTMFVIAKYLGTGVERFWHLTDVGVTARESDNRR